MKPEKFQAQVFVTPCFFSSEVQLEISERQLCKQYKYFSEPGRPDQAAVEHPMPHTLPSVPVKNMNTRSSSFYPSANFLQNRVLNPPLVRMQLRVSQEMISKNPCGGMAWILSWPALSTTSVPGKKCLWFLPLRSNWSILPVILERKRKVTTGDPSINRGLRWWQEMLCGHIICCWNTEERRSIQYLFRERHFLSRP